MEGIPLEYGGYYPVYLQPLYQEKIAFGTLGYPFTAPYYGKIINYDKGLCPVAERMWYEDMFFFPIDEVHPTLSEVGNFREAVEKIMDNREEIENVVSK